MAESYASAAVGNMMETQGKTRSASHRAKWLRSPCVWLTCALLSLTGCASAPLDLAERLQHHQIVIVRRDLLDNDLQHDSAYDNLQAPPHSLSRQPTSPGIQLAKPVPLSSGKDIPVVEPVAPPAPETDSKKSLGYWESSTDPSSRIRLARPVPLR